MILIVSLIMISSCYTNTDRLSSGFDEFIINTFNPCNVSLKVICIYFILAGG